MFDREARRRACTSTANETLNSRQFDNQSSQNLDHSEVVRRAAPTAESVYDVILKGREYVGPTRV